jgi:hypothetical protein
MFREEVGYQPLHIPIGTVADRERILRPPVSRSDTKRAIQDRQRAWLLELCRACNLKPSPLAKGAGVSDTTVTRLLNDPSYAGSLSQASIDRIKVRYGVPGPEEYAQRRPFQVGLAEAERLDLGREPGPLVRLVSQLVGNRVMVEPWRLKTNALELVGYLPGDIILVDMQGSPRPQDAVCAQSYDWTGGRAETIWRVFDPPYLVGAASDRTAYKPLLADNDRVIVKGVIVESYRPHALSATR